MVLARFPKLDFARSDAKISPALRKATLKVTLQHDHTRHPFEFPCDGIDRISRIDAVKFKQIMNKLLKLLEIKHARFAIIAKQTTP